MTDVIDRRALLRGVSALGGLALGTGGLGRAWAANLTIGIAYVGARDDFGWNQAHAVAANVLRAVPGVTVLEEERVPETVACAEAMEGMILQDKAKLILATSFGYYNPFVIDLARKYPDVQIRHCSTLWNKNKDPVNAGSYFCYLNQAHYVDGTAAGLSTRSNKIGFVAAKPISSVLNNINSFLLGVKKVNPQAYVQVIFTGEWSAPVREAEAANALVDAGCDVVACHVDAPKVVISTVEARGQKTCGHNSDQSSLAPNGFITGAEYKWGTIYKAFAADLAQGRAVPSFVVGGIAADMVANTRFGAGASPAAIVAANVATADLKADKPIFVGPLKDNNGKLVLDRTYANSDLALDRMDYLLEGIIGSTS